MQSKPNSVILHWNHLSAELSCQRLARVSKQSESQASFTLSHHFYSPHGSQTRARARESERGKRAPHDSTVIGSFSSLWTHSTHPSTHLTVLKPQHLTLLLLWKRGSAHTATASDTHTHTAKHVRTIRGISFNSIPAEVETPAAE